MATTQNRIKQLQEEISRLEREIQNYVEQIRQLGGSGMDSQKAADLQNVLDLATNELETKFQLLKTNIERSDDVIDVQMSDIRRKDKIINERNLKAKQQQAELERRAKILMTKDRMLTYSVDKNLYKRKVIYTLIALIFASIILFFMIYKVLKPANNALQAANSLSNK